MRNTLYQQINQLKEGKNISDTGISMGQKSSKQNIETTSFYHNEWTQIISESQESLTQFGKLKTLQNINTGDVVDKYQSYFFKEKDYEEYIKSYQWRKQENHIVRGYYIETQNNNKYCSTTYHVHVYIQHPKNRLSDFKDVPFPDTMYVLKAMLTGYAKLFTNVGIFPVKEEQVCIDQLGNVKVWLNSNLSKNYPEDFQLQPRIKSEQQEEVQMVSQIVNIIQRNSDNQLGPQPSFQQFFQNNKRNKKMGFDQTLMLISDYVELHNARVPSYFTSVLQVYEGHDDYNDGSQNRGELTQDQISQSSLQGSYHSRVSRGNGNKTYRSKQSRSSQIQNLQKYRSEVNRQIRKSINSNMNKGQTYRLSGASKLDEEIAEDKDKNHIKMESNNMNNNLNQNSNSQLQKNHSEHFLNRISEKSNGNISQASNPNQPRWTTHKPQQAYIPSSPTYLNLQNNHKSGIRNSQLSSSDDGNLYIRKIPQPNQISQQSQPPQNAMKRSQNSIRGSHSTNRGDGGMRMSTQQSKNPMYGSISQKAQQNNISYSKQKLLRSQEREFNTSGSQGYSMRKSHKVSKQNKVSQIEQADFELLNESKQHKMAMNKQSLMKVSNTHTNSMKKSKTNPNQELSLSKISLSRSNHNNKSVHEQNVKNAYQNEIPFKSPEPFGAKPFFISQYSQSPESKHGHGHGFFQKHSNLDSNLITQITNQQKTAQFINSGNISSGTENHQQTNSQFSKKSDKVSLEKNNSQNGFTIFVKSPSFQNMSCLPISPTHQPIFRDPSLSNMHAPPRFIKNNSQPYILTQNQFVIENRGDAYNINNMPISPRSFMPLNANQIQYQKKQKSESIPFYNSVPYQANQIQSHLQQLGSIQRINSNKQTAYCTVQQQKVEIDPEIAHDLLIYT